MKMALHEIDEQIREVENRIAVERIALDDAVHGCTSSLREAATSPKTLLALLGVGYAVGKLMFKDKKPEPQSAPVKKAGMLGLLTGVAGTALSLANARSGWGGIARWAAGRYFARRRAARAAAVATAPAAARSTGYSRSTAAPGYAASPAAAPSPVTSSSRPPASRAF